MLADGIWFANGVALSQDGDFVAVSTPGRPQGARRRMRDA